MTTHVRVKCVKSPTPKLIQERYKFREEYFPLKIISPYASYQEISNLTLLKVIKLISAKLYTHQDNVLKYEFIDELLLTQAFSRGSDMFREFLFVLNGSLKLLSLIVSGKIRFGLNNYFLVFYFHQLTVFVVIHQGWTGRR